MKNYLCFSFGLHYLCHVNLNLFKNYEKVFGNGSPYGCNFDN